MPQASCPEEQLWIAVGELCRSCGVEKHAIQKIQQDMQDALYSCSPEGVGRVAVVLEKINETASRHVGEW